MQNIGTVVAALVIAFSSNWKLSLIVLCIAPLVVIQGFIQTKFKKQFTTNSKRMYEDASQVANDAVGSIRTVASFCAEKKVMDLCKSKCDVPVKNGVRLALVSGFFNGLAYAVVYCANALLFCIGSILVKHGLANFGQIFKVFFALTIETLAVSESSSMADTSKAKDSTASIFAIIAEYFPHLSLGIMNH